MLRLSEIKQLLQNSPSVNSFKYWAEVILDFLLIGLFLLVILSWQSIFYTESAGLTCVATTGDTIDTALSDDRYITSRCLVDSPARFLLFYPYFQFLQFILLTFTQVMWLYIPKVRSKLELYHDIFKRIEQIEPRFEATAELIVPTPIIDESNREATTLIYDKLIFLVTEQGCIVRYFIAKNVMNLVLSIVFICLNMFWTVLIIKNGVDFACQLEQNSTAKAFPPISCNVSPFYFFIGYLCLFELLLLLILIFTIINLLSFSDIKNFESAVYDLFGPGGDSLNGLPGFFDFALYVTMHNKNVKDGGFHFQMIKLVINMHSSGVRGEDNNPMGGPSSNQRKPEKFSEELSIVSGIAERLHMQIKLKPFSRHHIYDCLKELLLSDQKIDLNVAKNVEATVLDEIKTNSLYYAYLLSGLVDNKVSNVVKILKAFDEFLTKLENEEIWPNNLVLAAAANLLQTKIVLVKTHPNSEHYVDKLDVFEPYSQVWSGRVVIFSLIQPHYYNILELVYTDLPEVLDERKLFVTSREFRLKVIDHARKTALRHLLNEEAKGHKKAKSLLTCEKNAASVRVYDDNFTKTVFFTSRPSIPRFRAVNFRSGEEIVEFQE